jgi:VWFA-related protein
MCRIRGRFWAAVALVAGITCVFGQNDTGTVLRFNVDLVQVDAVVRDSKGRYVKDLRAQDFEVFQDGKPQKITHFSYVSNAGVPLRGVTKDAADPAVSVIPARQLSAADIRRSIVLMVDDFRMSFENLVYIRKSLTKYIDEQVQPGDVAAVVTTTGESGSLQQFTSDKRQLHAVVDRLHWKPRFRELPRQFDPLLYSLRRAIRDLAQFPGRKSLVLFSEGRTNIEDPDSVHGVSDQANRASVVIYGIDARGLPTLSFTAEDRTPSPRNMLQRHMDYSRSQDILNYLATQTGGLFLHDNNDMDSQIRTVMEDQAGYYLIGWNPGPEVFENLKAGRQYHRIQIKTVQGGLNVRTRQGFFGFPGSGPAARPSQAMQLEAALFSPFRSGGIPLRLTALIAQDEQSVLNVQSLLHIGAQGLDFLPDTGDCYSLNLAIYASLAPLDEGAVPARFTHTAELHLCGSAARKAREDGLVAILSDKIRGPGAYQWHVAVRNIAPDEDKLKPGRAENLVPRTEGGVEPLKIGSASQFIEVPDLKRSGLILSSIVLRADGAGELSPVQAGQAAYRPVLAGDPALRRFRAKDTLSYRCDVLNADAAPVVEIGIYREGKKIFEGKPGEVVATGARRFAVRGTYRLDERFAPGSYVLEAVVAGKQGKGKTPTITQASDFEIEE